MEFGKYSLFINGFGVLNKKYAIKVFATMKSIKSKESKKVND